MSPEEKIKELIREAAVSVFVCDEDDKTLIDQYNLIMDEEDGDEYAMNVVAVWEPFDQWDIDKLRNAVKSNEEYLTQTINEIILLKSQS